MGRYVIGERMLTCAECGNEFVFTVDEQRFHRGIGFADELRCPVCLSARRARCRRNDTQRRSNRHGSRANATAVPRARGSRRAAA